MTSFREVAEAEATGDIALVYDDICRTYAVPYVSSLFRHLAVYPGLLPWAWTLQQFQYACRIALGQSDSFGPIDYVTQGSGLRRAFLTSVLMAGAIGFSGPAAIEADRRRSTDGTESPIGPSRGNAFLVSRSEDKISADRLDHAHRTEMAGIASKRGHERRDGPKVFHGWAIVTANDASANGRWVKESPLDDNPYHSDICMELPEGDERRDVQKEHSVDLAANATWEDAP